MTTTTSNRLTAIVDRQSKTRVRDLIFGVCVTFAAAVALTTIATASRIAGSNVTGSDAAAAHVAQR